jgi:hypothetical protein
MILSDRLTLTHDVNNRLVILSWFVTLEVVLL